ncbi:ABC transporter ATP-binding protein [Bacillus sp. V3B]|uniref:ABC transporter ATP-binding protein n=1 Tax=Bacillus sp. V3B TaxID=2804915 RepID=UPI002109C37B|nr:ABC transporter ATP-binding protein [Bacillus sp. V3B]MCQ6273571.1 ABC transporter ATP-binding protein [Bacillus sp. V3B]
MIQFENVSKKYGREFALKNLSFELTKGKIYGLLGPNGSGKSTTLKMMAGLTHPTTGEVLVNGREANRRIADEVAYLTELDMFYESFNVMDMIRFSASQFSDFDMDKAQELLAFMSLDTTKKIKQLSKGNRGRLKLVIALARHTSILLLDEPFSGLDPIVRESIVKGLISFVDFEHQTVVIATHEIDEIEALLDEVLAIQNGVILERRDVERLREEEGLSVLEWMKKMFKE